MRVDLRSLGFEYDDRRPEGFNAGLASFGPSIGASMLGATVYELPPGQSVGLYH
jgi:hypothetical protein